MSIAEEELDQELPVNNLQCLSAATHKHKQYYLEEESNEGEDFNFEEVDASLPSEYEDLVVKPTKRSKVSCLPNQNIIAYYF